MSRITRLLFPLALLAAAPAGAVICKHIDDQGQVSYSDVPADKCQHRIKLPEYSHYAPRPLAVPGGRAAPGGPKAKAVTAYTRMRIQSPADNGTVRSNEGKVPVQLDLEPALQKGHLVLWRVDGSPAGRPLASTSAVLTGVERGTHALSAQIVDANARVIDNAAAIHFTLHKESVEPAKPPGGQQGRPFAPRYQPKKNQSGAYKPKAANSVSRRAPKAPKPAPVSTPIVPSEGLNPAFQPNYRP